MIEMKALTTKMPHAVMNSMASRYVHEPSSPPIVPASSVRISSRHNT